MTVQPPESKDQRDVVDQSDDVRDPADDSGEADDPTALAETYPSTFDANVDEAAAAVRDHNASDDRRHGGGNG